MLMLSATLFLLVNSLFLTLRLTGNPGSFPKPLSAKEEEMYLARSMKGDLEARNILVEHNLRLVAHIIKKMQSKMPIGGFGVYIFRKNCATNRESDALR